jgi:hypothetical protein
MSDSQNKIDIDGDKEPLKLSPQVPEKVLRMWYVEDKKNNFQVKKVCEISGVKAIIEWDSKLSTIKNSVGERIKVYTTFGEAAENAILKKIADKTKKWESYVKASYILNNEIGELYESLNKLQEKDEDD